MARADSRGMMTNPSGSGVSLTLPDLEQPSTFGLKTWAALHASAKIPDGVASTMTHPEGTG